MYSVPIIPPDLRHEETVIQAAIALNFLQKTINSIFENLDARIERNCAKVDDLSKRINRAQVKIKGLSGTKRSIQIYAPSRFPATAVFHDRSVIFEEKYPEASKSMAVEDDVGQKDEVYVVQTRVDAVPLPAANEKLTFFHVRPSLSESVMNGGLTVERSLANRCQGLGAVPENLRSVSSLLLSNLDEQVYSSNAEGSDQGSNRLSKNMRTQLQRRLLDSQDGGQRKQMPDPAPHSLANRNQMVVPSFGLRYTPKSHEAPEIDLPLDLPDLPGIADDLHFEGQDKQQIAPSLFIDNLIDLLDLEKTEQKPKNCEKKVNDPGKSDERGQESQEIAAQAKTLPTTTPPPPPPPPPPPSTDVGPRPSIAGSSQAPPPPPPPPPVPLQQSLTHSSSDTRSELMEAIRKAGGAGGGRLRPAAAAEPVEVDGPAQAHDKKSTAGVGGGGGNLMADLHNKLLMRRKGISGARDDASNETSNGKRINIAGNPVMQRLSTLIPPPTTVDNDEDGADDDGNDDDNDWNE